MKLCLRSFFIVQQVDTLSAQHRTVAHLHLQTTRENYSVSIGVVDTVMQEPTPPAGDAKPTDIELHVAAISQLVPQERAVHTRPHPPSLRVNLSQLKSFFVERRHDPAKMFGKSDPTDVELNDFLSRTSPRTCADILKAFYGESVDRSSSPRSNYRRLQTSTSMPSVPAPNRVTWADASSPRKLEVFRDLRSSYYRPDGWSGVPTNTLKELAAQGTLTAAGHNCLRKREAQSTWHSKVHGVASRSRRQLQRHMSYP